MKVLYFFTVIFTLLLHGEVSSIRTPEPSYYPTSQPTQLAFQANVTAFDFDLSTGNLTMYFNDRMNLSTFDVERMALQNKPYENSTSYTIYPLTGTHRWRQNNKNQDNATTVSVFLTSDDYAKLVMNEHPIFTNASTSFLSLEERLAISLRNESSQEISVVYPLPVQTFLPDTLPPFLLSYELNMHVGYINLQFSEPVDMSTFTIVGMAIQGSRNAKVSSPGHDQYFAFMDDGWNVSSVSDYNRLVRLTLGSVNMNEIKRRIGLATTRESSWLSAYQPFVNDTHGNAVSMKAFDIYNGINAQRYWADTIPPSVDYWEIDMKTCAIAIFFTETIYRDFFNFSGVVLTNNDATNPVYLHVENPINTTVLNHPFLRFQLSPEQLLMLQSYDNFCSYDGDCFLILEDGLVVDTSRAQNLYDSNGIATVHNPLQVQRLQPDTVRPRLVAFDMSIESEYNRIVLTLSFSKVVKISTFKPQYLTLQSESNLRLTTEYIVLAEYVSSIYVNTTLDSTDIILTLYDPVAHLVQLSGYLGKATYYTYLACTYELVEDRIVHPAPNKVIDIPQFAAIPVRHLTTDRTPPSLLTWSLDLDRGILALNFTRPVDLSTIQSQNAILYSQSVYLPLSTRFLSLKDAVVASFHRTRTGPRTSYVELSLTMTDLMYLAGFRDFCTSDSNCFLSFTRSFVGALEDYDSLQGEKSYVPVEGVSFVPCNSLVTPVRYISVLNVTVDMTSLDVYVAFSIPVRTALINVTAIGLWVNDSSNVITQYLSSDSYIVPSDAVVQNVTIHLAYQDRIHVQSMPPLFTTLNTSVVTFQELDAVQDVYGNGLVEHDVVDKKGNGLHYFPANFYRPDRVRPTLLGVYAEEATYTTVTFYFSEAILPNFLKLSGLTAFKRTSGNSYSLSGAILLYPTVAVLSERSNFITVDLDDVKGTLTGASIFTRQTNTFAYLQLEGTVKDGTKGQFLNNTESSGSAFSIREGLTFLSFRLDLSTRTILLEMPFACNISSLDARSFTLVSDTSSYRLTTIDSFSAPPATLTPTAFVTDSKDHMLRIVYSAQDQIEILSIISLEDISTIKLTINEEAIVDSLGRNLARSPALTLPCVHLVYDTQPPYVSSFSLNVQTGMMQLIFSKPIEVSTIALLPSQLVLTSSVTAGVVEESVLRPNEVAISDAYLMYSDSSYLTNRTDTITLDLNVYPADATLAVGTPHMTMRELIMAYFPFTQATNNVYLRIPNTGIAYDLSSSLPPFPVASIPSADALLASSLVRDTNVPFLVAYTLNLNTRKLVLNFSEAINVNSLRIEAFTLAAAITSPSENYTLSALSSYVDADALLSPTNYVTIFLGKDDVDNMMRRARRLVLSPEQTYLSFPQDTFRDLATPANENEVVFYRYGIPVTNYVADQQPPVLLSYNLSMSDGSMYMVFSEVVDCRSFDFSRFYFQSQQYLGALADDQSRNLDENNAKLYLTNVTRCLGPKRYQTYHNIQLSAKDLIRLKATETIARSADSTFLGMDEAAFLDAFGNGNLPVSDLAVLPVTAFTPDTQSPQIVGFAVSDAKILTVYFDEPIDLKSINFAGLWAFQDTPVAQQLGIAPLPRTLTFKLSNQGSYLLRYNALRTMIELNIQEDFEYMYGASTIFKELDPSWSLSAQARTFFIAASESVRDMAGNNVQGIFKENALQIGPTVWYWDLDMNAGILTMTYTARSIDTNIALTGVTIASLDDATLSYTFQGLAYTFTRISDVTLHYQTYRVDLQPIDINGLKLSGLLNSVSTLSSALLSSPDVMQFNPRLTLSATFGVTQSTDSSDFVPVLYSIVIPPTQPRLIRYFVPDASPPECLGFTLNFNLNQLRLHFGEAVDIATMQVPDLELFSSTEGNMVLFPYSAIVTKNGNFLYENITISLEDDTDIVFHFTSTVHPFHPLWDELKRTYILSGKTLDSLVIRAGAIRDLSGNTLTGNTETSPFALINVVEDTTPPSIESYVVDLDTYQLKVTFDDIVNVLDYQPGYMGSTVRMYLLPNDTTALDYLSSTFDGSNAEAFRQTDHLLSVGKILLLSNFTLVEYEENDDGVDLRTLVIDLNFLRFDQYQFETVFAKHLYQQNTAVTFYRSLATSVIAIQRAKDWIGNTQAGFSVTTASEYIPHTTAPVVEAYDYEIVSLSSVEITLYFSTMMRVANFSCADWQLQDAQSDSLPSTSIISWLESDCTVTSAQDDRIMVFTLDASVLSGTTIGQSVDTTWLTTNSAPTGGQFKSRDIYDNLIITRNYDLASNSAILPTRLTDYNIGYYFGALQPGPRILEASLDMNSGEVIAAFSKNIDISAFTNISTWAFQFNEAFAGDVKSIIYLSAVDFDYVSYQPIVDSTLSTLRTFGPNFATSVAVAMTLSTNNLNRVKRLANNIDPSPSVRRDLYLYATAQTLLVDSTLQQPLVPVSVRINRFFPDTTNPVIRNATLDLSSEQLTLEFDEPIDTSTFSVTRLFLQPTKVATHDYNNDGEDIYNGYLRLQDSGVLTWSNNFDRVKVNFTRHDGNILKNHPANLALNETSAYLGVIVGAAQDKAGNYLQPFPQENAFAIEGFIPDYVSPYIVAFDLNMNTNPVLLTLEFSEPMDVDSFNITTLILQSRFLSTAGVAYQLTSGTIQTQSVATTSSSTSSETKIYSETISIALSLHDVNNMKRTGQLIRNKNSAFLRQENFGRDIAGNVINAIFDNEALSCRTFIDDKIPPRVVSSRLDMHNGLLSLVFDEPTILGSVSVTGLTLLSERPTVRFEDITKADYFFYRLSSETTASVSANSLSTVSVSNGTNIITNILDLTKMLSENITLTLSATDLNNIKRRYPLASSTQTTYFSVDSYFITDYASNAIETTEYRTAYAVSSYEIDRVRPFVTSYVINMNTEPIALHLTFSECIQVTSLQPQVAYLQNFNARRFGQFLNMNNTKLFFGALPVPVERLAEEVNGLQFVKEFMANPVPVPNQLSPANQAKNALQCQQLTMFIDRMDDIHYLRNNNIGIDATRSFFTFTEAFVQDHASNAILPQFDGSVVNYVQTNPQNIKNRPYPPLSPSTFVPDTKSPSLTRWFYDNASLTLNLDFSEPILMSTDNRDLYISHAAFLSTIPAVKETLTNLYHGKPLFVGLPLFLNRYLANYAEKKTVDWKYLQQSTRVRYTFDAKQDDYCISYDYIKFLLRDARDHLVGPQRNILLLNYTHLHYHNQLNNYEYYSNKSCAKSIFTGEYLGLDFLQYLNTSSLTQQDALQLIIASGYSAQDRSLASTTAGSSSSNNDNEVKHNYVAGTIGKSQNRNPALDAINVNYKLGTNALGYVLAGTPVCGACPDPTTQYIVQNCTSLEDRVCATCRICSGFNNDYGSNNNNNMNINRNNAAYDASIVDISGNSNQNNLFASASNSKRPVLFDNQMYEMFPCRGFMDRVCAACRVCPYGSYIQQPCNATSDTVCAKCTASCPNDEDYIVKTCSLGYNTICNTCNNCALYNLKNANDMNGMNSQKSIVDYCHRTSKNAKRNQLWFTSHCCANKDGLYVPCNNLVNSNANSGSNNNRKKDGVISTSEQLRLVAEDTWQRLQTDSIRFDYDELSPMSAN